MPYIPMLLAVLASFGGALWLALSLRDITRCRADLERADKQLSMYLALYSQARDGPEKARTREQVEISQAIYNNVTQAYNLCLEKTQNLLLSHVMGYHNLSERDLL